jgi:hypothetical protein
MMGLAKRIFNELPTGGFIKFLAQLCSEKFSIFQKHLLHLYEVCSMWKIFDNFLQISNTHLTMPAQTLKHIGFQAAQAKIAAKEGVSSKAAGAILAASSRNASKAAKQANPKLRKVKG